MEMSKTSLKLMSYPVQKETWPKYGRHIFGQFDDETIVVYQAYNPDIASYAVENQKFGGPHFSMTRMTWIKTNFLWMMYRCGWCTKPNQERVLAIWLKRATFEHILSKAIQSSLDSSLFKDQKEYLKARNALGEQVRLQWDPDHNPTGTKHPHRRAIQLGLKGVKDFLDGSGIAKIEDITEFVKEQYEIVLTKDYTNLQTPIENIYEVSPELRKILSMDKNEEHAPKENVNSDKESED